MRDQSGSFSSGDSEMIIIVVVLFSFINEQMCGSNQSTQRVQFVASATICPAEQKNCPSHRQEQREASFAAGLAL